MKKVWRKNSERITVIITTVILLTVCGLRASAQVVYTDPYDGFSEEAFMDMDLEPNLATPVVPDAEKAAVAAFIESLAHKMSNKSYNTELMREGEVMVMTIPSDRLFLPNDTLLNNQAERYIRPLYRLMKDPLMFKVVIAVHTDDTGSPYYREQLSTERLYSIYEFLLDEADEGHFNPDVIIIPYSLGSDEPVEDNNTRKGRAANRRVEFYFVPGPKIIEAAHNGTLNNLHL